MLGALEDACTIVYMYILCVCCAGTCICIKRVHVCSMCGAPLLHVEINNNEGRAPHIMIQTEIENTSKSVVQWNWSIRGN